MDGINCKKYFLGRKDLRESLICPGILYLRIEFEPPLLIKKYLRQFL